MSSQEQLDSKRRRVSRACDTCRRKKVRCDGVQPACTNCTAFGFQCTFNDSAKKRGPPKGYIEALENRLHRMENLLGGLVQSGERPKSDLDSWREDPDEDLDSFDSAWPPHSPDNSALTQPATGASPPDLSKASTEVSDSPESENEQDVMPYDRDARLKINVLSDSMDSMSLDDGGFIRYLGNSSGIDLLQKNQLLKNGYLMVPVKVRDHQEWLLQKESQIAQLALTMPLPPKDLTEHLIECYWTFVHPHLPVVHKPTFMRQFRNPDPEKRLPVVLLNAMFAIASRFSDHPEIIGHGHDTEGFGDEYFERAKRLVDFEYELPRQSSIQALLLMTAYRFTSAKSGGRVWVMLGMATRMAQDMGMHRNSARWHLPPLETEIRKRLWWACYTMDRWVSASMGRPMAIDDNDCDVGYPAPMDQDWADPEGQLASPHENSEKNKEESAFALRYLVETIKLAQILGQILRRIYGATTRSHGPIQVSSTVAELDTTLTKWLLALPQDLKYDHETMTAPGAKINRWVATIHSSYYNVLILLHRPYMVPTSLTKSKLSESMPSLNIAVSAANSITHLLGKLDEDDNLKYSWNFVTYEAFTSSLIHLTNSASIDLRLQAQARKNLVRNIGFMKKLGAQWFNAAKFSLVLEDLMCAHLNFDGYKPEGRSLEPVIIAKMCEADSIYPIILRDQNHPSGGTLLFAPKAWCGTQHTPSSNSTTPGSSPSMPLAHHPDMQDAKHDANRSDFSTQESAAPASSDPSLSSGNSAAASRPMKKGRKPTSQRNSLLFHFTSGNSPSPTGTSPNNTISAPTSASASVASPSSASSLGDSLPDTSIFTFSSLTTPGMFAQGQAFMDYDQMMAQQQLQLQQHQQHQQHQQELNEQQQLQPFSATPLFSSPFALQSNRGVASVGLGGGGIGQQAPIPAGSLLRQQQPQDQQMQQQTGQSFIFGQQQQQQFPTQQNNNFTPSGYSSSSSNAMDTSNNSNGPNGDSYNFVNNGSGAGNNGMNLASAIPASGIEDYSNFSLFPQQQQQQQQQTSNGIQEPSSMAAAVPNPFFGIPNTIDWDEWNQYIASAGLQKL